MKHIDKEIQKLSNELGSMWLLVLSQLEKAQQSYLANDMALAREVIERENYVDAYELQIDRASENHIALYSPVAIDLRQILALMSISRTLERIGDFAAGIALHVISRDCEDIPLVQQEELGVAQMMSKCYDMLGTCYQAYTNGNTLVASRIIEMDQAVHSLYNEAPKTLTSYLTQQPHHIYCGMKLLLLIRKLERIGNHCCNIVEDLVFYLDAKVLKHSHQAEGKR